MADLKSEIRELEQRRERLKSQLAFLKSKVDEATAERIALVIHVKDACQNGSHKAVLEAELMALLGYKVALGTKED